MNLDTVFFLILAAAAVISAAGMLLNRNAIYAALFLILNFATVGIIYFTLSAPFVALTQVTVYAGAIMVLFLFVIMLLGAEKLPYGEGSLRTQRLVAIGLAVVLLVEAGYFMLVKQGGMFLNPAKAAEFGTVEQIGKALFNTYMLPFEVTSLILLAAVVGAIMLTRIEKIQRAGQTSVEERR